jgi:sugar/nucleoside kinase (ribokinase family)
MTTGYMPGAQLTIIGGASIDTLHLDAGEVTTAGGAGLYTALAARRAGSAVTMVAPKPVPTPVELAAAAAVLDWRGPEAKPGDLPHFDISYDGSGRRTLNIDRLGREGNLDPRRTIADLPAGLVYVVPLTDPRLQLEFVRQLKAKGRWVGCGTYPCGAREKNEIVREAFDLADAFFCNEEEAEILFGTSAPTTRAGKFLFVTCGSRGVRIAQGEHVTEIDAVAAIELDPTGAGDAFCGGTLAALANGRHPVEAARSGAAIAAQSVTSIGIDGLLSDEPSPAYPEDPRVSLDSERISTIARWLGGAPQVVGFDFCGESFPEPGHSLALRYFFSQTLQQFGFWTADERRYQEPMIALAGGQWRKGSDYLWFVYRRLLDRDPQALTLNRHRTLERRELDDWYRSDDGVNPVPASDLHYQLARSYGEDLAVLGKDPAELLAEANASTRPVATLLGLLDHVSGYKEDPLRKKSALLALVLRQRPEAFLRSVPGDDLPPIVDYHIQRSCLRTGLVTVRDGDLASRLSDRRVLSQKDEEAVRRACYRAVNEVQGESGKPMAAVDWFFFQNRRRCPEMSEPDCSSCEVESVCGRRKDLFQPVFRTTFY